MFGQVHGSQRISAWAICDVRLIRSGRRVADESIDCCRWIPQILDMVCSIFIHVPVRISLLVILSLRMICCPHDHSSLTTMKLLVDMINLNLSYPFYTRLAEALLTPVCARLFHVHFTAVTLVLIERHLASAPAPKHVRAPLRLLKTLPQQTYVTSITDTTRRHIVQT